MSHSFDSLPPNIGTYLWLPTFVLYKGCWINIIILYTIVPLTDKDIYKVGVVVDKFGTKWFENHVVLGIEEPIFRRRGYLYKKWNKTSIYLKKSAMLEPLNGLKTETVAVPHKEITTYYSNEVEIPSPPMPIIPPNIHVTKKVDDEVLIDFEKGDPDIVDIQAREIYYYNPMVAELVLDFLKDI